MWYNHDRLRWQFAWRGASLMNTRVLVCDTCYDTPQQQLRAIVVPGDPTPILNARVESFVQDETNTRYTSGQNTVDPITGIPIVSGNVRVTSRTSGGLILLETRNGALLVEPRNGYIVQEPPTVSTGDDRVTQQTGEAPGGRNQLPGIDWNVPEVIYGNSALGLPYNTTEIPFTGPLSPPYNYTVQWNNTLNWGILTGSYWTNNVGAYVSWTTTIL